MLLGKILFWICALYYNRVYASLTLGNRTRNTFDTELYNSVLDSELCERQVDYIKTNVIFMAKFLDASFRIPKGLFTLGTADYGSYHECLAIQEDAEEMSIEGKYCFVNVPLNQNTVIPSNNAAEEDSVYYSDIPMDRILSTPKYVDVIQDGVRSIDNNVLNAFVYNLGVCIPKSCTTQEWAKNLKSNVSIFKLQHEELFCRLPNDKPFVPADYVAIAIFSIIGFVTVLSTGYDLYYTYYNGEDTKAANMYLTIFSVYTNGRRLRTFRKNPYTLDCLDGIRTISMMWVIVGHTYSTSLFTQNNSYLVTYLTTLDSVWLSTGLYAVDTFLFMTGLLLVYSTVGKMSQVTLMKNLHYFYLNRLFRIFPLLAMMVLLQMSVLHHIGDGPYWLRVAELTEQCRHFWWSTLLNVQNYVNPMDECILHSWYIAIDIQLHILSPLVLFWILSGSRKTSWTALIISNLMVLVIATVFNFTMNMPSALRGRFDYYLKYYYKNTLTRAAPFFIGMIYGYILYTWKEKKIKINKIAVCIGWLLSCIVLVYCAYLSSRIMHADWDSQTGDNLYNSFARVGWSMGMGWIILACVKGYGGPLNWFLSLEMWKFPARLSYAMYLCHYPIQFFIISISTSPLYFSVWDKFFEYLGILLLSFIVAYVMMLTVDAPFSVLLQLILPGGRGSRKSVSKPQQETAEKEII